LSWRLVIAGDGGRSPETFRQLKADIAAFDLADRITLLGAVSSEQVASLYQRCDLFALPSRFEGYGMVFAEALAHGLPVVGTTAGAIPQTVAAAGVLVPPDDVEALAAALRRLIEDPAERERLSAAARAARFPSWREQAAAFARVLESVA
jgi:glycosyltransferase involved in cell wall biosynthesis